MNDAKEFAEALWYAAPGRAEIRREALPPLAPGSVRVRALHGAVSRGTEALVMAGGVPESEFQRMRAPFMGGIFPFPVKYGYATVGRIEAGPAERIGQTVFALHPHQTWFDVPADAVAPLPEDVPPARGVLAANLETALTATWDANGDAGRLTPAARPGRIAIVGAGVVGALTGLLFAKSGDAEVTLIDIDPARADLARTLGLHFALPAAAPRDCGLVVHASASAAGLATAFDIAANEATVLEMSWYGAGAVSVPLGGAFHSRRLRLVSSQVGQVAPSHRATWTHRQRLSAAIELLADPRLDALIAPAVAFHDLPARLPAILAPGSGVLCQRIDYL